MQASNYPSVLKLKEIEASINMLLNSYNDAQASYVNAVSLKSKKDMKKWLTVLNNTNSKLTSLVEQANTLLKKIVQKGELNQEITTIDAPKLKQLSRQLNMQGREIHSMQQNIVNVNADLETSKLQQQQYLVKLIFMFFVAIIIVVLIIRAFFNNGTSVFENIILVIAIMSIIYHLIF